jgi:hypothetical protein
MKSVGESGLVQHASSGNRVPCLAAARGIALVAHELF